PRPARSCAARRRATTSSSRRAGRASVASPAWWRLARRRRGFVACSGSSGRSELPRVKRAVHSKKKRRQVLEAAKGYYGARSRRYRVAKEQLMHSGAYAYRDRRDRKGQFRRLWITRIGAAARANG